jgi:AraC-like DNA-binding protein
MIATATRSLNGPPVDRDEAADRGAAISGPRGARAAAVEDVLRLLRLTGGVFLESLFTAPWSVATNVEPERLRLRLSPTAQVIGFHYVTSGRLVVHLPDGPATEVAAGELIFAPRNDLHVLGSAPGLASVASGDLDLSENGAGVWRLDHGGGGAETRVVCGFLTSDAPFGVVLSALPRLLTVKLSETPGGAWIEASLTFASRQMASGAAGATIVVARLSELMVAEAVRRYLEGLTDEEARLFCGFNDPSISRALDLMHAAPAHAWSCEDLAHAVSLSRSAFADRFSRLTGQPPMRYLSSWRMHLAARGLRETPRTIAQISFDVGYESEAAFTRAFRRVFGEPPVAWRKRQKALAEAAPRDRRGHQQMTPRA